MPEATTVTEDEVYEQHGARVVVNRAHLALLAGMTLDFQKQGLNESFKFLNPNVSHVPGFSALIGFDENRLKGVLGPPALARDEGLGELDGVLLADSMWLADAVWTLGTAQSPVTVVDINSPWDYSRDTYDGLHPNVRGEYVIAKAFADAISRDWGLGSSFGSIPASSRAWTRVAESGRAALSPRSRRVVGRSACICGR